MTDPVLFAAAILTLLGVPGPTNTLLFASGATVGLWRSLPLLAAEAGGYTLSILAVGFSFSALLSKVPNSRRALCIAAGVYLCRVAWEVWHGAAADTRSVSFKQVFLTTLLNPKVLVFALVIIPLHVAATPLYMFGFLGLVVPVGASWIFLGAVTRSLIPGRRVSVVPRLAAVVLVLLAAVMITSAVNPRLTV